MTLLAQRLGVQPLYPRTDLTDLADWEAAAALNRPDPSLPEITTLERTMVNSITVMDCLGFEEGAAFLAALRNSGIEQLVQAYIAMQPPSDGLNIAKPSLRVAISALTQPPVPLLTDLQSAELLALAEKKRHLSWAEHHNIKVTDHTVGEARLAAGG